MSCNDLGDNMEPEIPPKRIKIEHEDSNETTIKLSSILQREIKKEIELRKDDLNTIEDNIFLTKQCLFRLKQGVVSDYYKEKCPKEYLQPPPHPAIKDTFLGKTPRNYIKTEPDELNFNFEEKLIENSDMSVDIEEVSLKKEPTIDFMVSNEETNKSEDCLKHPCYIPPKPVKAETLKPPDPRGLESKKQLKIVVGNVSKWLASSSGATHKWTVYAKSADPDTDLSDHVSKVVFFLHPSYKPNDLVTVTDSPFKITRRGWGEFPLKARFHFKNSLNSPVDIMHVLKLDSKHTGLETFGSETTLSLWIHLPTEAPKHLLADESLHQELQEIQECTEIKKESQSLDNIELQNSSDVFQSMLDSVHSELTSVDVSLEEGNFQSLNKFEYEPALSDYIAKVSERDPSGALDANKKYNVDEPIEIISESCSNVNSGGNDLCGELLNECNVVESEVVIDCVEPEEVLEEVVDEVIYDFEDVPDIEEHLEMLGQPQISNKLAPDIDALCKKYLFSSSNAAVPNIKYGSLIAKNVNFTLPQLINNLNGVYGNKPVVISSAHFSKNDNCSLIPSSSGRNVKAKQKNKAEKGDLKSTVIELQKENGQVIFRKEAKYKEYNDKNSSPGTKLVNPNFNLEKDMQGKNISQENRKSPVQCSNLKPKLKFNQTIPINGSSEYCWKGSKSIPASLKFLNSPELDLHDKRFRERAMLNKCPTQSTEIAVNWLIRRYPLVDSRAVFSGFRNEHPYCAKSREEFLNWPFPKQRAAEWMRAKTIERLLMKIPGLTKWSTLEIWDWARIRAFTPMQTNIDSELPLGTSDIKYFYNQPSGIIFDFIRRCKDLKEQEIVDVISTENSTLHISGTGKTDFKYKLAPKKIDTPFEPELAGLRKHINKCQMNVGALTSAELVVPPDVLYPAAERVLISAFHSILEDIIRRAHNASWIRYHNNVPPEISIEDVKCALISRKEFDFLLPSRIEKRERPPVTVLPNFS